MKHEPEFYKQVKKDDTEAREMAACYARVFMGSDDGKRVLADLRRKFGLTRLVFREGENGRYDTIRAALIDGERHVMTEIEQAIIQATQ